MLPENKLAFQYDANSIATYKSNEFFDFIDELNCGLVTCRLNLFDTSSNTCTELPLEGSTKQDEYVSLKLKSSATINSSSIYDITVDTGI